LRTQPPVGTITGGFRGALDGIPARLVRRTTFGYTVELLEATGDFDEGDRVNVRVTEFELNPRTLPKDSSTVV
jgi:hypothetical protein